MRSLYRQRFPKAANSQSIFRQLNTLRHTDFHTGSSFASWPRNSAFHSGRKSTMSDKEYQKFLDEADKGTDTRSTHQKQLSIKNAEHSLIQKSPLPDTLQALVEQERVYSTDSDEPFRAIYLAYQSSTTLVSEASFKDIFGKQGIEVGRKDFDAHGGYSDVIDCVAEAAQRKPGDVQIFKTRSGQVRSEYWIITVTGDEKCVIGFVATAIES